MTVSLAARLTQQDVLVGAVLNMVNTTMVEVICKAGADFLFLDFEHGLKDFTELGAALLAAELHDTPTLVRVGERSPNLVARILDAGASGILFPHVSSAAEATDFVSWCRYAPKGLRGSGFSRAGIGHQGNEFERRGQMNDAVACFMIVEDLAGANQLKQILEVDGVTGIAIGPGDLSMQLGVDRWDHPAVTEVLERMAGLVAVTPHRALMRLALNVSDCASLANSGANMLLLTHDVQLVGSMYRDMFKSFSASASRQEGSMA